MSPNSQASLYMLI